MAKAGDRVDVKKEPIFKITVKDRKGGESLYVRKMSDP